MSLHFPRLLYTYISHAFDNVAQGLYTCRNSKAMLPKHVPVQEKKSDIATGEKERQLYGCLDE